MNCLSSEERRPKSILKNLPRPESRGGFMPNTVQRNSAGSSHFGHAGMNQSNVKEDRSPIAPIFKRNARFREAESASPRFDGSPMSSINRNNVTNVQREGTKEAKSVTTQNMPGSSNGETNIELTYFGMQGNTSSEKVFTFTGTVERIIKWYRIFKNHFCYFEVIATVVSIQEGSIRMQKVMLLRDKKGPILQVLYYTTTHMDIEDFHLGQTLRCVGRMTGPNIFCALSIRAATEQEISTLQRYCCICDRAIAHFLTVI